MHAEDAYLFRHALLRDAAYQMQMPGDRAKLHYIALQLIESVLGESTIRVADEMAGHAREARLADLPDKEEQQMHQDELHWCSLAQQQANVRYDLAATLRFASRVVKSPVAEAQTRCQAMYEMGQALQTMVRWKESENQFHRVVEFAEQHNLPLLRANGAYSVAHQAWLQGRAKDADEWMNVYFELVRALDDRLEMARARGLVP